MNCMVCYEPFGSQKSANAPRITPCGHVACSSCLADCFEDETTRRKPTEPLGCGIRCPECFTLFITSENGVLDLPIHEQSVSLEGTGHDDPTDSSGQLLETDANILAEAQLPPCAGADSCKSLEPKSDLKALRSHKCPGTDSSDQQQGVSSSRLAEFIASVPMNKNAPVSSDGPDKKKKDLASLPNCKYPGCPNKDTLEVGYCPKHTKRASIVSVNAMVDCFKTSSLTNVALTSEKLEVRQGTGTKGTFDPEDIAERFRKQERLELGEAMALVELSQAILEAEPNVLEIHAPVMVVGDVHGQYFDLLNILSQWQPAKQALLFLGDYVDRGAFSCEVILHLLSLKLRYPKKVFIIRGNHECSTVCSHFGFKEECKSKYGLAVFYKFLSCFQAMPICGIINSKLGRIFCCHGGISPQAHTLDDVKAINRFAEPDMEGALCDILWADPINEDDAYKLNDEEYKEFLQMDFVTNQVRGCSYMFGYRAAARFLRDNNFIYMLRAHEVQEDGFRSHFSKQYRNDMTYSHFENDEGRRKGEVKHPLMETTFCVDSEDDELYDIPPPDQHMHPTVLTVFSAPNYCDRYGNKAAVLHVEAAGYYSVSILESLPHPEPKNPIDVNVMQLLAMGKTCPYMPTSFREFLRVASDMGTALQPEEHSNNVTINSKSAQEDLGCSRDEGSHPHHTPSKVDGGISNHTVLDTPSTCGSLVQHMNHQGTDFWADVKTSLGERIRKQGRALDIMQDDWGDILSPARQYVMAHARDGINEMHPDAINSRLCFHDGAGVEDSSSSNSSTTRIRSESSYPPRVKSRQFSLDMSLRSSYGKNLKKASSLKEMPIRTPIDGSTVGFCDGLGQIAQILGTCTLSELVSSDRSPMKFSVNEAEEAETSSSEDDDMMHEGGVKDRRHHRGPSQVLFTHEEIVVLKLLFSLFDRKGKNFITRDDIVAYAEECGDYAQLKEVDACMDAVDADCDGKIGLVDYIYFASRLKIHWELKECLKQGDPGVL